jgi:hypothetical protein
MREESKNEIRQQQRDIEKNKHGKWEKKRKCQLIWQAESSDSVLFSKRIIIHKHVWIKLV